MRKLIILLLCVILLTGCGDTPIDDIKDDDFIFKEYEALLGRYELLLSEVERLENANAEYVNLQDEYNKLILDYHNLQTQYVILEAYSQTIRDQYTALIEQFSTRYVDSGERYTELYKMNMKLVERYKELDGQIVAVHSGNVSILSDNLTDSEYSVFYKGWKLWWGEFND